MRALIFGLMALLLAGCVTGQQARQLGIGMARTEVVEIMGAPDGVQANGQTEVLKYSNRLMSGWSWDTTDYYVTLVDGRVTGYGNGEVRQNQPPRFYVPPSQSPSQAQPVTTVCMKSREWTTGITKQCAYNCLGSEVIQTIQSEKVAGRSPVG